MAFTILLSLNVCTDDMVTMRKYLILVMFVVLSKLTSGEDYILDQNDLADRAEYMDEEEPLTLPPPTPQTGCVMLNRPVSLTSCL